MVLQKSDTEEFSDPHKPDNLLYVLERRGPVSSKAEGKD